MSASPWPTRWTGAVAKFYPSKLQGKSLKTFFVVAQLKFGLLLPHFCELASVEKCLEGSQQAEAYGFDSVWVRDHIVFKPHEIEGNDNTHIEGFLILSAVSSVTQKITLGTAMTICHRHPIHLAQLIAGLSVIAQGRVILGIGLGGFAHEFAAVGRPTSLPDRAKLVKANIEICRRLWAGEKVTYSSDDFSFENIALKPTPAKDIPIWIGGGSAAACRRAVELGTGWMPARINLTTFARRVDYLRELCRRANKPMLQTAVMPLTSIGESRETSLRGINVKALSDESQRFTSWVNSPSAIFSPEETARGILLAGTPADIVRETQAYAESGADHIVYDLRLRYADWQEQLKILGTEVLPALRG
jgi:alkanesulfonate monooxygenase SsuD/methylene tetrahydromethanopterin reductase-like flavin-dependent oxidoreductase (luciferase family)